MRGNLPALEKISEELKETKNNINENEEIYVNEAVSTKTQFISPKKLLSAERLENTITSRLASSKGFVNNFNPNQTIDFKNTKTSQSNQNNLVYINPMTQNEHFSNEEILGFLLLFLEVYFE